MHEMSPAQESPLCQAPVDRTIKNYLQNINIFKICTLGEGISPPNAPEALLSLSFSNFSTFDFLKIFGLQLRREKPLQAATGEC